jgi:hypothetical protein
VEQLLKWTICPVCVRLQGKLFHYVAKVENVEPLEERAVSVQEARNYFNPPPSDQTIYRLVWAGKLKVLDQPGIIRIPISELRKFFGRVRVYKPRRAKKAVKASSGGPAK